MEQYKIGIIGATGMVGQRFALLTANHPWFQPVVLAASSHSAGKTYKDAPASGAFAQGAFGAVHSGGAVAGVQLHDATAAFFRPGHHDFCARPAAAGVAGRLGMPSALLWAYSAEEYLYFRVSRGGI